MNHAPKKSATVKPFKPLKVNGKWRVAFIAARDIEEGEANSLHSNANIHADHKSSDDNCIKLRRGLLGMYRTIFCKNSITL